MRRVLVLALFAALATSLAASGASTPDAKKSPHRRTGVAATMKARPAPASPAAGGDNCPGAPIAALPFADSGTTIGANDTVTDLSGAGTGCTTGGNPDVPGLDVIYTFTAGTGNSLTFTVTPTNADYDPAIFLLSSCSDGTTCVRRVDTAGSGAADTLGPISLTAGSSYYFFVDSFYYPTGSSLPYAAGPYNVSVSGTLPAELMKFEVD